MESIVVSQEDFQSLLSFLPIALLAMFLEQEFEIVARLARVRSTLGD